MKRLRVTIGTILLASAAAAMTPLTASAARGGGGHGGGFGGGGFHGGGFGGGGFHGGGLGGFHGGGFHLGGGGHIGGSHLGGGHIGGTHLGHVGNTHSAARQSLHAGNQGLHAGNHGHGPLASRMSSSFSHRGFGRDRFGGHFHRFGVFGWVGPLFWPYAYNDIYCDVFWGYWGYGCADPYWSAAYGDPFWGYGYGDIYGGMFSPFASDDLASYLPNGTGGAPVARSKNAAPANAIAQMCGDDTKEVAGWPVDRIQDLVSPDDKQRVALDDLANASVKAAEIIKSGCPTSVAFTPTGRLAAMQQRIETMQQAVETVRGPLDTFYGSLTDEQKAKFSAASPPPAAAQHRRNRTSAPSCTAANGATQWPEARIEAALKPSEAQQAKLGALQTAASQAAEQLAASCPSELPTTPPARLAAISKRLDAMLTAVKTVRGPLDELYAGLSDEQKAQFNQIGQSNTAAPQG
jgi:Spy/CpxP family protein refolding chaperone